MVIIMNVETITGLRVKLQRRWMRLRGSNLTNVAFNTRNLFNFLKDTPLCQGITEQLSKNPELAKKIEPFFSNKKISLSTEEEAAYLGWNILISALKNDPLQTWLHLKHNTGGEITRAIETYLEPLFDYLDEALDSQSDVLGYLLRFQQWAEWFGYETIQKAIKTEKELSKKEGRNRKTEAILQKIMFEHLFNQGLSLKQDFHQEPHCGVGRTDFLFTLTKETIPTEVKIFPDSKGKSGLAKGFHQILSYMDQYQVPVGYLVIFNRDPKGLRCQWVENDGGIPKIQIGGKTIYIMIIAAVEDPPTASEKKKLDPIWLTKEELTPPTKPK